MGPLAFPSKFRSTANCQGLACFSSLSHLYSPARELSVVFSMKKALTENFSPTKRLAFQVNSAYLTQLLIQHIFTEHLIHTCSQGSCSLNRNLHCLQKFHPRPAVCLGRFSSFCPTIAPARIAAGEQASNTQIPL